MEWILRCYWHKECQLWQSRNIFAWTTLLSNITIGHQPPGTKLYLVSFDRAFTPHHKQPISYHLPTAQLLARRRCYVKKFGDILFTRGHEVRNDHVGHTRKSKYCAAGQISSRYWRNWKTITEMVSHIAFPTSRIYRRRTVFDELLCS